ncbi:hypothetical protein ANA_C10470 [Anabaena sp. 90]|nr:hypothetical protein ANA_C10470 [Anabaena sp. 90]
MFTNTLLKLMFPVCIPALCLNNYSNPKRLFEKYYMKPIISKNLTPLPPFRTREWGF